MANNNKDEKPKPLTLGEMVKEWAEIDISKADPKALRDKYLNEGLGMAALSAASAIGEYKTAVATGDPEAIAHARQAYVEAIGTRVVGSAIVAKNGKKHFDYLDNVLEAPIDAQEALTVNIGHIYFTTVLQQYRRRRGAAPATP